MTPDVFLLLTEFFKTNENLEILDDDEFIDRLFDTLSIINKAHYFDAVVTLLLVRFHNYWESKDATEEMNDKTHAFLNKILYHKAGRMFIETLIHLLNRRGGEGFRTILWLSHILTYDKVEEDKEIIGKIYSNDFGLLKDILEDEVEKDMTEEQRESIQHLITLVGEKNNSSTE